MKIDEVKRAHELVWMLDFIKKCLKQPLKVSLNFEGVNGMTTMEDIVPFLEKQKADMERELREMGVDP